MTIEFSQGVDTAFGRRPNDRPQEVTGAVPPWPITAVERGGTGSDGNVVGEQPTWQPPAAVQRVVGAAAAHAETSFVADAQEQDGPGDDVSDPGEPAKPETGRDAPADTEEPPVTASSGGNDKPPTKYPPAPGAAGPSEPERPAQPASSPRSSSVPDRSSGAIKPTDGGVMAEPKNGSAADNTQETAELTAPDTPTVTENSETPVSVTKERLIAEAAEVASQPPSPHRARTTGVFTGHDKARLQIEEFGLDFDNPATHCEAMYHMGSETISTYENTRQTSEEPSSAKSSPNTYIVDTVTTGHPHEDGHVLVQKVYSSPDGGSTKGPELITKTEIQVPRLGDEGSLSVTMLSHDNSSVIDTKSTAMSLEQDAAYRGCRRMFGEGSLATAIVAGNYEPGAVLEAKLDEFREACDEMEKYSPEHIDNIVTWLREIASAAYKDPSLPDELTPAQLDRLATFVQECSNPEVGARADQPGAAPVLTGEDAPLLQYTVEYKPIPDSIVTLASEVVAQDGWLHRIHISGVIDTLGRPHFQAQPVIPPSSRARVAEAAATRALTTLETVQASPEIRNALGITNLEPSAYIVEHHEVYESVGSWYVQVQKFYPTPDNGVTRGDEIVTVTTVRIPSQKNKEEICAKFYSRKDGDTIVTNISAFWPMQVAIYKEVVYVFGETSAAADIASGVYAPGPDLERAIERFENTTRAAGTHSERQIERCVSALWEAASLAHKNRNVDRRDAHLERIRRFVQERHSYYSD